MSHTASEHLGESLGTDFFSVREQFTDEQWEHFVTVRRFVDEEVVPVVGPYWERAEICWPLVNARIMGWLIPRSQLHVYHGGHLELAAHPERIAPVVEAFLGHEGADDGTGG